MADYLTFRHVRRQSLVGQATWVALAGSMYLTQYELGYGCPFRQLTGAYCPGCGGTRALFALARGQVATAIHDNVLALLVGSIWAAYVVMVVLGLRLQFRQRTIVWLRGLGLVLVVLWTVFRSTSAGRAWVPS